MLVSMGMAGSMGTIEHMVKELVPIFISCSVWSPQIASTQGYLNVTTAV